MNIAPEKVNWLQVYDPKADDYLFLIKDKEEDTEKEKDTLWYGFMYNCSCVENIIIKNKKKSTFMERDNSFYGCGMLKNVLMYDMQYDENLKNLMDYFLKSWIGKDFTFLLNKKTYEKLSKRVRDRQNAFKHLVWINQDEYDFIMKPKNIFEKMNCMAYVSWYRKKFQDHLSFKKINEKININDVKNYDEKDYCHAVYNLQNGENIIMNFSNKINVEDVKTLIGSNFFCDVETTISLVNNDFGEINLKIELKNDNFINLDENEEIINSKENTFNLYIKKDFLEEYNNLTKMFKSTKLKNITFGDNVDNIKKITDMSFLFCDCKELEEVKFGYSFSTNNCKSYYCMFKNCSSLKSIDVSKFKITNATENLENMFVGCNNLKKIICNTIEESNTYLLANGLSDIQKGNISNFEIDFKYFDLNYERDKNKIKSSFGFDTLKSVLLKKYDDGNKGNEGNKKDTEYEKIKNFFFPFIGIIAFSEETKNIENSGKNHQPLTVKKDFKELINTLLDYFTIVEAASDCAKNLAVYVVEEESAGIDAGALFGQTIESLILEVKNCFLYEEKGNQEQIFKDIENLKIDYSKAQQEKEKMEENLTKNKCELEKNKEEYQKNNEEYLTKIKECNDLYESIENLNKKYEKSLLLRKEIMKEEKYEYFNFASTKNEEDLKIYELLGKMVGLSLNRKDKVFLELNPLIYKTMIYDCDIDKIPITIEDMKYVDYAKYSELKKDEYKEKEDFKKWYYAVFDEECDITRDDYIKEQVNDFLQEQIEAIKAFLMGINKYLNYQNIAYNDNFFYFCQQYSIDPKLLKFFFEGSLCNITYEEFIEKIEIQGNDANGVKDMFLGINKKWIEKRKYDNIRNELAFWTGSSSLPSKKLKLFLKPDVSKMFKENSVLVPAIAHACFFYLELSTNFFGNNMKNDPDAKNIQDYMEKTLLRIFSGDRGGFGFG